MDGNLVMPKNHIAPFSCYIQVLLDSNLESNNDYSILLHSNLYSVF